MKKDFWDELHHLNEKLLSLIETPDEWPRFLSLLEEREQLMKMLADFVRRGHARMATKDDLEKLRESQKQLVLRTHQEISRLKSSLGATDKYRQRQAPTS